MSVYRNHAKDMNFSDVDEPLDLDDTEVIDLNDVSLIKKHKEDLTHRSSPSNSALSSASGSRRAPPQLSLNSGEAKEVLLTGIFGVDDKTYDVTLHSSLLVLTIIGGKLKASSGRKMSVKRIDGDKMEIWVKDLFGANLRRMKPKVQNKQGACQGIELHTYSERDSNKLKHKILFMAHPSEEICSKWVEEIWRILKTIVGRPKTAKCYIDVDVSMKADFLYKVCPVFTDAGLVTTNFEEHDHAKIAKDIETSDFTQYDCVIVVGGDSVVNCIVDGLLKKVQFDNGIVLGGKESLQPSGVPVGVIPIGVSNIIGHTVHGTSDTVTAALDIVYGRTLMSDVLSVSHSHGGFYKFVFSAQYGFGGTIMDIVNKSRLASNKYQLAIAKALTKSKLRAYGCEVKYKPAPAVSGDPSDGKFCRAGCTVCNNDSVTPCPDGSNYSDPLQEFDPLDNSTTSSQFSDIAMDDRKGDGVKGEFLSVSLYSTPSPCDMAPLGLSKYTHIADGFMDLVLVRSTERKEFMRFLKRNGNSKNQMDFPFVESYRVREVSFHVRMPVGWNYRDKDYSEIDDQVRKQNSRLQSSVTEESIQIIADGDKTVISNLRIEDDSESSDEDDGNESSSSKTASIASSSHAADHGSISSSKDINAATETRAGYVHAIHKYTDADRRLKRKEVKDMAKEMKAKAREEKAIKSVWNLDSTACTETDLTFRPTSICKRRYTEPTSRSIYRTSYVREC